MPLNDVRPPRDNRTLVHLGTVRKGTAEDATTGDGKKYRKPKDEDFFVLKDAPALAKAYGAKPKELKIYMPFPEARRNFDANYELWRGGVCHCRGDGVKIAARLDDKGFNYVVMDGQAVKGYAEIPAEPRRVDGYEIAASVYGPGDTVPCSGHKQNLYPRCSEKSPSGAPLCSATGVLLMLVRDPLRPTAYVNDERGYYTLRTGSLRDIETLTAQLETIEYEMRALGAPNGLQGVQLVLRRIPESMTYPDEKAGKRKSAERAFLHVLIDPDWVAALAPAMQRAARQVLEAGAPFELPDRVEEGQIIDPATGDLTLPVENGNGHPLPTELEALVEGMKDHIHDLCSDDPTMGQLIDEAEAQALARDFQKRLGFNNTERHAIMGLLIGSQSATELCIGEDIALRAWFEGDVKRARQQGEALLNYLEVERVG